MAITAEPLPAFGRLKPALCLLMFAGFLGLHHWYAVTNGEYLPKMVLFLCMGITWCLGGILYPPAFYALTNSGNHLPKSMKAVGAIFGLAGLGLGFYVLLNVYK